MEEIIPNTCLFKIIVQLRVSLKRSDSQAVVNNIFMNLTRENFEFDVTWISSHFHNLNDLWIKQSKVIQEQIFKVLLESFSKALQFIRPVTWLKLKFQQIDNEILAAERRSKENLDLID